MSRARRETATETATAWKTGREDLDAMLSRLRDTLDRTESGMRFAMEQQEVDLGLLACEIIETLEDYGFGDPIEKQRTGNPKLDECLQQLRDWTHEENDDTAPLPEIARATVLAAGYGARDPGWRLPPTVRETLTSLAAAVETAKEVASNEEHLRTVLTAAEKVLTAARKSEEPAPLGARHGPAGDAFRAQGTSPKPAGPDRPSLPRGTGHRRDERGHMHKRSTGDPARSWIRERFLFHKANWYHDEGRNPRRLGATKVYRLSQVARNVVRDWLEQQEGVPRRESGKNADQLLDGDAPGILNSLRAVTRFYRRINGLDLEYGD